jgi:heme/copper-type cytochrome/quinol oxidase subunit 4
MANSEANAVIVVVICLESIYLKMLYFVHTGEAQTTGEDFYWPGLILSRTVPEYRVEYSSTV